MELQCGRSPYSDVPSFETNAAITTMKRVMNQNLNFTYRFNENYSVNLGVKSGMEGHPLPANG